MPGTGDHLCRYRGYPEHPERKRPGTHDKPEVVSGVKKELSVTGLKTPEIIKVAV